MRTPINDSLVRAVRWVVTAAVMAAGKGSEKLLKYSDVRVWRSVGAASASAKWASGSR